MESSGWCESDAEDNMGLVIERCVKLGDEVAPSVDVVCRPDAVDPEGADGVANGAGAG